jgi:KDO2-lipid IV(A) lauroyltransferase
MYRWIGMLTDPRRHRRIMWTMQRLPRPLAFALVTAVGWGIFLLARRTRQTVIRNVGEMLPHLGRAERTRFCRRYIVHECLTVYEQTLEYPRGLAARGGVRFHLDGLPHLDEALGHGRGAIVYTPHVGNYFYSYWRLAQQYPCVTVVTGGSLRDRSLRRLFLGFRRLGLRGWNYDEVPPAALTLKLRQHLKQNGVAFLLGDFSRPNFHPTSLFGKPARIPAGAVALALRLRVPIVPFVGTRESWSDHRLLFKPALHLYERYGADQRDEAMSEVARLIEHLILEAPHQWLYWFNVHERWTASAVTMPQAS